MQGWLIQFLSGLTSLAATYQTVLPVNIYTIQAFLSPFTAKCKITTIRKNNSQTIAKKTTINKKGFTNFTRN